MADESDITFYKCSECGVVVEDVFDLVGHSCWRRGGESTKLKSKSQSRSCRKSELPTPSPLPSPLPVESSLVTLADGLEPTSPEQSISQATGDDGKSPSTDSTADSSTTASGTGGNANANWSEAPTRLLIAEYKNYEDKISTGKITKSKVWSLISKTLEQHNYFYLPSQVEGKWKTLLDRYRRVRDGVSGSSRQDFIFYEELDEFFEGHPNITPPAMAGSSLTKPKAKSSLKDKPAGLKLKFKKNGGTTKKNAAAPDPESEPVQAKKRKHTNPKIDASHSSEEIDVGDNESEEEVAPSVPKSRNTQASIIINHLEKTRKESEKAVAARHADKMNMWRELIDAMKQPQ